MRQRISLLSLSVVAVLGGCATQINSTTLNSPSRAITKLYMADNTPVFDARHQEAFFQAVVGRLSQCGIAVEQSSQLYKKLPTSAPMDVRTKVAVEGPAVERQRIADFRPDAILSMTWKDMTVYKQGHGLISANLLANMSETGTGRTIWTATIDYKEGGLDTAASFGDLLAKNLVESKLLVGCSLK